MSEKLFHTLAALKAVAYGGPVAMALATIGTSTMALALWDGRGEHYDVFIVGGVTLLVLGWLEIALSRRFHAHEQVEKRQYQYVANIADSAAQALSEITRVTRGYAADVTTFRAEVGEIRNDMAALMLRVVEVEKRLLRPALTVPVPRRPPGEMP